jgi:phosphoribosyl 1,2-cyclic phosphodiesterase
VKFSSLGSGSKGNGTLVSVGDGQLLLIDCGFTLLETEKRLQRLGVSPNQIDAILVTHEHGDHIRGVGPLARKFKLPVYMTAGTARSGAIGVIQSLRIIHNYRPFFIKELQIFPIAVPHDANEPAQYIFGIDDKRLGLLTDLGNISQHVENKYVDCDALIIEANHDPLMLASGPYPKSLKERVGGAWGHLSNQQASEFLQRMDKSRLQCLVVAHISQQNNSVQLAQQAFSQCHKEINQVIYACQEQGFNWLYID